MSAGGLVLVSVTAISPPDGDAPGRAFAIGLNLEKNPIVLFNEARRCFVRRSLATQFLNLAPDLTGLRGAHNCACRSFFP